MVFSASEVSYKPLKALTGVW